MAAPKGNQFWKLRSKHGRDKLFSDANALWEAAMEYFEWVEKTPLIETRAFSYQGEITTATVPIMRAMTLEQLCFYLKCNEAYFRQFKESVKDKTDNDSKDFSTVIADIESIIKTQKFQGAAGGLLNANIISRDLGLRDNTDHTTNGKDLPATPTVINVQIVEPNDE